MAEEKMESYQAALLGITAVSGGLDVSVDIPGYGHATLYVDMNARILINGTPASLTEIQKWYTANPNGKLYYLMLPIVRRVIVADFRNM